MASGRAAAGAPATGAAARPSASGSAPSGALALRVGARVRAIGRRALAVSVAAPGRVLAIGLVVAVAGLAVGTRAEVISDLRELVPADLPELQNVDELQEATGVSGEVEVAVRADDITDPAVVAWMGEFKQRVLDAAGFGGEATPCAEQDTRAVPVRRPARPVRRPAAGYQGAGRVRAQPAPPSTSSPRSSAATTRPPATVVIPFGIKVMPFDEQKELIDAIRAEIDPPGTENDPPEGVTAEVVGLPVLAADANSALESNRYLLTLAGLAAVALALLAVYRSARRALVPLIPIVLATGWSSLGLAIVGVPLNPMSATLGALVIAIATEFSVLLAARYEEERDPGVPVGEALRRAYSRTGMAVLASGITAIAGFAALIATDIRMLRDFGIVTVLDLGVALVGVLVVLPAALIWAETGLRDRAAAPRRGRDRAGLDGGGARLRIASRIRDERRARAAGRQAVAARASRYSLWVGVAFVILIVVATANTLSTRDDGILGVERGASRRAAARVRASPTLLGSQRATPTSSRTTARPARTRARRTSSAPRPARSICRR